MWFANCFYKNTQISVICQTKGPRFTAGLIATFLQMKYRHQTAIRREDIPFGRLRAEAQKMMDEILFAHYIIPPMPGLAGAAGSGAGISAIAHSLVRIRAAMLAAF